MRVPVVAAGIATSFCALTGAVILMALYAVVTPQRALLMLIALAGLYIGFGILILVRRLIDRLD